MSITTDDVTDGPSVFTVPAMSARPGTLAAVESHMSGVFGTSAAYLTVVVLL